MWYKASTVGTNGCSKCDSINWGGVVICFNWSTLVGSLLLGKLTQVLGYSEKGRPNLLDRKKGRSRGVRIYYIYSIK